MCFFARALDCERVPSAPTLRQRFDTAPHSEWENILHEEAVSLLRRTKAHLTPSHLKLLPLDVDVTPFDNSDSHKEGVALTYKKVPGYAPQLEVDIYWPSLRDDARTIVALYHKHGTTEQFHSEIKSELDLERLPSGKFTTNSFVLHTGMLAYNMLRARTRKLQGHRATDRQTSAYSHRDSKSDYAVDAHRPTLALSQARV